MSTATAPAAALPDYDSAYRTLFGEVGNRVFFHKLASFGHVPANEKQAAWLLDLGMKLEAIQEEPSVKQAEEANDPYFRANQALDQIMSKRGLDSGLTKAAAENESLAIKQAAADWMRDDSIYNAVLAIRADEALSYARQHGLLPAA